MTRTTTYLLVFILVASTLAGFALAAAPYPATGTAVVDGVHRASGTSRSDFFANMYRAGNAGQAAVESKAYLRYNCATGTVYVLVLKTSPTSRCSRQGYETRRVGREDHRRERS